MKRPRVRLVERQCAVVTSPVRRLERVSIRLVVDFLRIEFERNRQQSTMLNLCCAVVIVLIFAPTFLVQSLPLDLAIIVRDLRWEHAAQGQKKFLENTPNVFQLGQDQTRVALLLNDDKDQWVVVEGKLIGDQTEFQQKAINSLFFTGNGDANRNLVDALKAVANLFTDSKRSHAVVVMNMGDGVNQDEVNEADKLRRDTGACIFVISEKGNKAELAKLTGNEDNVINLEGGGGGFAYRLNVTYLQQVKDASDKQICAFPSTTTATTTTATTTTKATTKNSTTKARASSTPRKPTGTTTTSRAIGTSKNPKDPTRWIVGIVIAAVIVGTLIGSCIFLAIKIKRQGKAGEKTKATTKLKKDIGGKKKAAAGSPKGAKSPPSKSEKKKRFRLPCSQPKKGKGLHRSRSLAVKRWPWMSRK